MYELTLGQLREVCICIRAMLELGDMARAEYWLARLRGEELQCSAKGCGAQVDPLRRWCPQHRPRFVRWPRRTERYAMGRAREAVLLWPDRTTSELAEIARCSEPTIRRARRDLGLPGRVRARRGRAA